MVCKERCNGKEEREDTLNDDADDEASTLGNTAVTGEGKEEVTDDDPPDIKEDDDDDEAEKSSVDRDDFEKGIFG